MAKPANWSPGIRPYHDMYSDMVVALPMLEGAGGTLDKSRYVHAVACHNITWETEAFGTVIDFDGDGDYCQINNHASFATLDDVTIAVLAKPDGTDANGHFIYARGGGADGFSLGQRDWGGGKWAWRTWIPAEKNCESDAAPSAVAYTSVIGIRESGVMTLYINGVAQADTETNDAQLNISGPIFIGIDEGMNYDFAGRVAYLGIWNRALSAVDRARVVADPFVMHRKVLRRRGRHARTILS